MIRCRVHETLGGVIIVRDVAVNEPWAEETVSMIVTAERDAMGADHADIMVDFSSGIA